MKVAIFGGTFDPVHKGHLQAATLAADALGLDRVLFVPSGRPPHKHRHRFTPFLHRFAMVVLACSSDSRFVPSAVEAPWSKGEPNYSIQTVRMVRRGLGPKDRLFFLVGRDAFLDLPHWKSFDRLLDLADFIVVSRPGFGRGEILKVVPPALLSLGGKAAASNTKHCVQLRRTAIYILDGLDVRVASSDIRAVAAAGRRRLAGLVPPLVEEYIRKEDLYRPPRSGAGRS